ncbi:MAG: formylglycine-generating enzyme family protein [Planctomycetota bacterium]
MKSTAAVVMMGGLLASSATARAEVVIEWVPVGDVENVNDTHGVGYGGVDYEYRIAKYEVTYGQYAEFLNAVAATDTHGLYNTSMAGGPYDTGGVVRSGFPGSYTYSVRPGRDDTPVDFVSFYDALRFANWLHNDQQTGAQDDTTTEDGVYDVSLGPGAVRKDGARVFLPTEDEWYKAAYYKGGGTDAGYWDYATQSNALPTKEPPPGGSNSANYDRIDDPGHPLHHLTDVGAYTSSVSPYGTFDQTGNVWEWNEALIGATRGLRGGSWMWGAGDLPAYFRYSTTPTVECDCIGFRLATALESNLVPTVSEWRVGVMTLLILTAGVAILRQTRRRSTCA